MTSKQNQLTQKNRLKIKRWSNRIAWRLSTKYDLLNGRFGWFTEWPTGLRQKLEKEKTVVTRSPRHFLLLRSQHLKFLNGRWPGSRPNSIVHHHAWSHGALPVGFCLQLCGRPWTRAVVWHCRVFELWKESKPLLSSYDTTFLSRVFILYFKISVRAKHMLNWPNREMNMSQSQWDQQESGAERDRFYSHFWDVYFTWIQEYHRS